MADMLKFLRGPQTNLDALSTYEDGAFYLTTDTNRLYIGKGGSDKELLNSSVQVVANVDALPKAPPAIDGDFYYCKEENALAIYDAADGKWTQINVDSYIDKIEFESALGDEEVIVTETITDSSNRAKVGTFKFIRGNNIELGVDDGGAVLINAVDEKATKAGHYDPTEDSSAKLTATSGKYITAIKRDDNGHVVGIEEGAPEEITFTNAIDVSTYNKGANIASTVNGKTADFKIVSGNDNVTVTLQNTDEIVINAVDEKTTKAGHYIPTAEEGSKLTLTNQILTSVERDSKGHITNIVGANSQEDVTVSVTATNNEATLDVTTKNVFGVDKSDSITITGGNNTTITATNDKLTISSTDEKTTEAGHYEPKTVASTKSAKDGTVTAAKATTQVVTGVQVDSKGHIIGVTSAGIKDTDTHNDVSSVTMAISGGAISTTVATTDGTSRAGSTPALAVNYGENKDQESILANDGKFDLNVYTIDEVNNKIAAAVGAHGAVEIIGTIAGAAEYPVTTEVKKGYTYIVTSASAVEIYDKLCTAGDMFIASADGKGNEIEWYYVPAGNDIEKFAKTTNGLVLTTGAGDATLGALEFVDSAANAQDFNVKANVVNTTEAGGYNKTQVSYNLYWGSF